MNEVKPNGDMVETLKGAGQFNTLVKALDATNLTGVLKNNSNLTVFAPTDQAFAALPAGELDRLMQPENRADLQKLLTYHLINARLDSTRIDGAKGPVPTVAGENVQLDGSGEALMVGQAEIVQADVMASNGVIHVVDKVLMPGAMPEASASAGGQGAAAADGAADMEADAAASAETSGSDTSAMVGAASSPPAAAGAARDAAAQIDVSAATMQPIPDTPENRAEHGAPLSSAGKRTAPQGN
ncbi:MAG: fasciclin domain-containing protein [Phenylobacterium sp.]|nr:fasciclin domain-containing protein [Phenylobacterium sp.]